MSDIGTEIKLSSYRKESLQGDAVLSQIYQSFGVKTDFQANSIVLKKVSNPITKTIHLDLNRAPDIAQTIVVTAFGLGLKCNITGLHTLKIKETDRLEALKTELTKLGAEIDVTNSSLTLQERTEWKPHVSIKTYNDHRMAMAFAPLGIKVPIKILDSEVVTKSYKNFWRDLKKIGFIVR